MVVVVGVVMLVVVGVVVVVVVVGMVFDIDIITGLTTSIVEQSLSSNSQQDKMKSRFS